MPHRENTMSRMKEERDTEVARPDKGSTVTAQGETQSPKPRMPHERDESADSQAPDNAQARRIGEIAHDDVVEGQQDTSKALETDATYHGLRQDAPPAPQDKPRRGGSGDAR
jgi:hypothetical protein